MKKKGVQEWVLAKRVLFGCIIAYAVYFALSAVAASLVIASRIEEADMPRLVAGLAFVSTFAGALTAAGQGGSKRPLAGFAAAGAVIVSRAVISAFLPNGSLFDGGSITVMISMIFAGMAAGLLCAGNTKKRKRRTA